MGDNVSNVRSDGATPPQVVRRAPRERKNGDAREFDQELAQQRKGRGNSAPEPSAPRPRPRPDDPGADHVDVTA